MLQGWKIAEACWKYTRKPMFTYLICDYSIYLIQMYLYLVQLYMFYQKNNLENPMHQNSSLPPQVATFFFWKGRCHSSGTKCHLQSPKRNTKKGSIKTLLSFGDPGILRGIYQNTYQYPPIITQCFLHFFRLAGVFSYAPFQLQKPCRFSEANPWHLNAWHMLKDYKAKTSWFSCQFVHHDLSFNSIVQWVPRDIWWYTHICSNGTGMFTYMIGLNVW